MLKAAQKKEYLLVTLKEVDEDLEQKILELALQFRALAYSYKEKSNSYIFSQSPDSLRFFDNALHIENYPVSTEMILYSF